MLSERGVLYLVALKQNNLPEIQERMKTNYGLESEVRQASTVVCCSNTLLRLYCSAAQVANTCSSFAFAGHNKPFARIHEHEECILSTVVKGVRECMDVIVPPSRCPSHHCL